MHENTINTIKNVLLLHENTPRKIKKLTHRFSEIGNGVRGIPLGSFKKSLYKLFSMVSVTIHTPDWYEKARITPYSQHLKNLHSNKNRTAFQETVLFS